MQFPPTIDIGELVTRSRDTVIVDASWLYSPFNKARIDVRVRYSQAHIPASWFLNLRSLARAYPPADGRVDALTRPPRAAVRGLIAQAAPSQESLIVITDIDCRSAHAEVAGRDLGRIKDQSAAYE